MTSVSSHDQISWGALLAPDVAGRFELLKTGATPELVARHCRWGSPVYLATPYSKVSVGPDGIWRRDLSEAAMAVAARESARLLDVGVAAVSPIVLSGAMIHATMYPSPRLAPLDAKLWRNFCRPILDACCAVVVPDVQGWSTSGGVWHEVKISLELQVPVFLYAAGSSHGEA
jgi:hypothetical protein